jgi:hypothetical protein
LLSRYIPTTCRNLKKKNLSVIQILFWPPVLLSSWDANISWFEMVKNFFRCKYLSVWNRSDFFFKAFLLPSYFNYSCRVLRGRMFYKLDDFHKVRLVRNYHCYFSAKKMYYQRIGKVFLWQMSLEINLIDSLFWVFKFNLDFAIIVKHIYFYACTSSIPQDCV